MQLRDAVALARSRLDDDAVQADGTPGSQLWPDSELIGFFREAQREAAERARLLYDETSSFTQLPVVEGQSLYPLHWSIFDVRFVRYSDTQEAIERTTPEYLDGHAITDDYGLRRVGRWRTRKESKARAFYLTHDAQEKIKLNTYPIPKQTTYTDDEGTEHPLLFQLSVYRYPIWPLQRLSDRFEIAAKHHERLLDWVLFRCYSKRDSDTYRPEKAQASEAAFMDSFGIRENADRQRRAFEMRPAPTRGWGM